MKVRIALDMTPAVDAHRALGSWIDGAEAGDMDGDELDAKLRSIVAELEDVRLALHRALGQ